MYKKITAAVLSGAMVLGLAGCDNMTNQDVGTIAGGLAGAAIGSQFGGGTGNALAIVGGTLAGAYLGNRVGRSMDQTDRNRMSSALNNTKDDEVSRWSNSDTNSTYTVEPTRSYQADNNKVCREFTQKATIQGKEQVMYGTACRPSNCSDCDWTIQNREG